MSNALPAELQSNIKALRFMAIVMAVGGFISILGIPWALLYTVLAITLKPSRMPNRGLIIVTAVVTLPLCILLAPVFFEVSLWRMAKRVSLFETYGNKVFKPNKTWGNLNFMHRYALAIDMVAIVLILSIMLLPLPHTTSQLVSTPFATQYIQDSGLELGDQQIRQPGTAGQGLARQKYVKPVFALVSGASINYGSATLPTETTQAPVNQIIAKGTKKYQYMWCSDGGYSYYTNDQFKDPNTGFTHKSADDCAAKKKGHMTGLADTAPPQQTTRTVYTPTYTPSYTPTYTTCHDYSFMNEFSCTSY